MRAILISSLVILTFSACSKTEEKKENIASHKISAITEAKKSVEKINQNVKKSDTLTATIAQESKSGESLYTTKCSSCHGKRGEKTALNSSQVIAGWEKAKIQDSLNGYKDGTYGGKMKGIMRGQVVPLNKGQIERLSTYIASL